MPRSRSPLSSGESKSPSPSPSPSRLARSPSPTSRIPADAANADLYQVALAKLVEAVSKFNRERDGSFLKEIDNREIDKELFRIAIRGGMNARLSIDELNALMPHFDNNGYVNGCEFILLMYRLRFEFRSKLQQQKLAKERAQRDKDREWAAKRAADIEAAGHKAKISYDYTAQDVKQALEIVTEAAFRYDRAMPGTVQLEAFECEYLEPTIFKEQLRRVFNIHLTPSQLGAFLKSSSFFQDGVINCAGFLVYFLRTGFNERAQLLRQQRQEKERINEEREKKRLDEIAELATKNALKVSLSFQQEDRERAMTKLRDAAKYYDKAMPGCMSMQSFEVLEMPPHVFKEQLKRVFNLTVSSRELGALMSVFDENKTGKIVCSEFSKTFLAMGIEERAKEYKANLDRQRQADAQRLLEAEIKAKELAGKNSLQVADTFTQADFEVAMHKLTEAAFKFDKSMPGSASLDAFEGLDMEAHVFKEQMRRAFNMKLSPPELAALMNFFEPQATGRIICKNFLQAFLKKGFEERAKKAAEWRVICKEGLERLAREEEEKKSALDRKVHVNVGAYTEAEYNEAQQKLTLAALKYHKDPSSNVGLDAFQAEHLPPHVFKEQLKLSFNLKVSPGELAAIMAMFDANNSGVINCKNFLNTFFRIGHEQRDLVAAGWRDEQRNAEERAQREIEEREAEKAAKQLQEVDFEFVESDFDSALWKFLIMCHGFEQRQLGPAGLSGFQCAYLTPSEFREMFKRTFGVKVVPRELGALVRYFEIPTTRGVVNCTAFLNLFVQLRVRCEEFKGKADEQTRLKAYHTELKEAYQDKTARAATLSVTQSKPWRTAAQRSVKTTMTSSSGASKFNAGARPKTPADKLKLRLSVGKETCRMDLSVKSRWTTSEQESAGTTSQQPFSLAKDGGKLKDKAKKALKDTHAAVNDIGRISSGLTEFRLTSLPDEIFKLEGLTELWFDNHNLGWIPSKIGDLVNLEILSMGGNNLEALPVEICSLRNLKKFYARKNALVELPSAFDQLKNLTDVDLSFNSFSIFPLPLTGCPKLVTLALNKTNISELPLDLKEMRSLSYLDLEGCPIKKAPPVLGKMAWLDVNGCVIPATPRAAFRFKITEDDSEEIESFLRTRASNRITAKLRRRKGKTSSSASAAVTLALGSSSVIAE